MAEKDQAGVQWQKQLVKEALAELLNEIPALKALAKSGGKQQGPSQVIGRRTITGHRAQDHHRPSGAGPWRVGGDDGRPCGQHLW